MSGTRLPFGARALVPLLVSLGGCAGHSDLFESLLAARKAPPPCTTCNLPPASTVPAAPRLSPDDPSWSTWGGPVTEQAALAVERLVPLVGETWLGVEAAAPEVVATLAKAGLARVAGPYRAYECALVGELPTPPVEAWAMLLSVRAEVVADTAQAADGALLDAAMKRVEWLRRAEVARRLPILVTTPTGEQAATFDAAVARGFAGALYGAMPGELRQKVVALATARVVSATPRALTKKTSPITVDIAASPPAP